MLEKSYRGANKDIKKGDRVLVLIPGGKRKRGPWKEDTVAEIRQNVSRVCCAGRETKIIAREDVSKLPHNQLGEATVRAQHGVRAPVVRKYYQDDVVLENIDSTSSSSEDSSDESIKRIQQDDITAEKILMNR